MREMRVEGARRETFKPPQFNGDGDDDLFIEQFTEVARANDWKEREHWDDYRVAYQDVLDRSEVPWTIVPVDDRWYRDYIVSKTMVETLEKLDLAFPPLEVE